MLLLAFHMPRISAATLFCAFEDEETEARGGLVTNDPPQRSSE